MSSAIVQKGVSLLIGCNGITYTGTIMDDVSLTLNADVEDNKDENGGTVNKTITNPRKEISFTATVKGSSIEQPAIGDSVTVNGVAYFCTKSDVKYSKAPKACQFSFSGVKEDSMA